jgi:anti-sigma regulatory factor (Ser/Thr protein kinase)
VEHTRGATDGSPVDRLVLVDTPGVVGRCREFVHASLAARGWLDEPGEEQLAVVEDVLLMTSELVTNACLHAGGPRELAVSGSGRAGLRIEVLDTSPELPTLRPLTVPARPGGHGLRVVERLARNWGSEPRAEGKAVWFEIDRA